METLPPDHMSDQELRNHIKAKVDEASQEVRPEPSEEEDKNVKDLKEVIAFGITLTHVAFDIVADGIGPLDVIDLIRADELRDSFGPAVDNVSDVPAEVADLSVSEGFEISRFAWNRIERLFL